MFPLFSTGALAIVVVHIITLNVEASPLMSVHSDSNARRFRFLSLEIHTNRLVFKTKQ